MSNKSILIVNFSYPNMNQLISLLHIRPSNFFPFVCLIIIPYLSSNIEPTYSTHFGAKIFKIWLDEMTIRLHSDNPKLANYTMIYNRIGKIRGTAKSCEFPREFQPRHQVFWLKVTRWWEFVTAAIARLQFMEPHGDNPGEPRGLSPPVKNKKW